MFSSAVTWTVEHDDTVNYSRYLKVQTQERKSTSHHRDSVKTTWRSTPRHFYLLETSSVSCTDMSGVSPHRPVWGVERVGRGPEVSLEPAWTAWNYWIWESKWAEYGLNQLPGEKPQMWTACVTGSVGSISNINSYLDGNKVELQSATIEASLNNTKTCRRNIK